MINRNDVWRFPRCSKIDMVDEGERSDVVALFVADPRTSIQKQSETEYIFYDKEQALLIRAISYPLRLLLTLLSLITLVAIVVPVSAEDPIGYLYIQSLGLHEAIYDAPLQQQSDGSFMWDESDWDNNVAHLSGQGMYWIGSNVRVVLVGHNPGIFGSLFNLNVGDLVKIKVGSIWYTYSVTNKYITSVTDVGPVQPTPQNILTLITCWGTNQRLVIEATFIETVTLFKPS